MDRGWIKLWRKLADSEVFQNPNILKMFIWGLLKATHKETFFSIKVGRGDKIVHLKPGQFIFGRHQAAKELKITPSSARNWLHFIESAYIWDIQKGQHYSIVTFRNYNLYQGEGKKVGQPKRTTKGQPKDTYKNVKNVKKYSQDAEEVYLEYPKKADESNSLKSIQKLLESGMTKEMLVRAVMNYRKHIKSKGTEKDFVIQSNNFFGKAGRYKEFIDLPEHKEMSPGERAMQRCKERGDY